MGKVEGKFRFINLPFLEQMPLGVMSNNGVHFSSKPLLFEGDEGSSSKNVKNKYFKDLITQKNKLVKSDKH